MKIFEPPTDEVMDYRGLSKYLKFAYGTLRHKVMRGEIPFYKIGGSVRFSKRQIDAWLEEKQRKPGGMTNGN
jgi:excisionase family DNA binding protein